MGGRFFGSPSARGGGGGHQLKTAKRNADGSVRRGRASDFEIRAADVRSREEWSAALLSHTTRAGAMGGVLRGGGGEKGEGGVRSGDAASPATLSDEDKENGRLMRGGGLSAAPSDAVGLSTTTSTVLPPSPGGGGGGGGGFLSSTTAPHTPKLGATGETVIPGGLLLLHARSSESTGNLLGHASAQDFERWTPEGAVGDVDDRLTPPLADGAPPTLLLRAGARAALLSLASGAASRPRARGGVAFEGGGAASDTDRSDISSVDGEDGGGPVLDGAFGEIGEVQVSSSFQSAGDSSSSAWGALRSITQRAATAISQSVNSSFSSARGGAGVAAARVNATASFVGGGSDSESGESGVGVDGGAGSVVDGDAVIADLSLSSFHSDVDGGGMSWV